MMSIATRFSEEEQLLLTTIPSTIGSAMAFSESSGVFGTMKEMMANVKSVLAGAKDYPNNDIIKDVLPNLEDRKEAMEKAKAVRDAAMSRMKEKGIDSYDKLRSQLVEDCRTVSDMLASKASDQEAAEYKEWAMSIAEKVATAAKEGGFLGFGGEQVSEGEKATYREVADAFGVDGRLA